MTNLLKSNKHIKLLPNNLSNKQIVNEGIDVVLTVYGTVASEFPYFFVPVINASPNPHTGYNFSISLKILKQYKKLILNLHIFCNLEKKINKNFMSIILCQEY